MPTDHAMSRLSASATDVSDVPPVRGGEGYALFDTAIGACGLAWSGRGITRLQLPEADAAATERRLQAGFRVASSPPPAVANAMAALRRYFNGDKVDFSTIALDLPATGTFQSVVYAICRRIPWGSTATYGELAAQAGDPGGARAVGQAMARNPIPVIVPCHRVLASGRQMGGFSAPGGTLTKRRLLALEGVPLPAEPMRLPGL